MKTVKEIIEMAIADGLCSSNVSLVDYAGEEMIADRGQAFIASLTDTIIESLKSHACYIGQHRSY